MYCMCFSASLVKCVSEMCAYWPDDWLMVSCDNKNKIVIGAPANGASRRVPGVYMSEDRPILPDHTFPGAHCSLCVF